MSLPKLKSPRNFRLLVVIFLIAALYGTLLFNLYELQIVQGGHFAAKAASQSQIGHAKNVTRGNIYFTDKHNNKIPAAINKTYPVIFAVPKEIDDAQESAAELASILNLDASKLALAFSNKHSLYELLSRKAPDEDVQKIKSSNLKGVYIDDAEFRFYPFSKLAAHVLGFVGYGDDGAESGQYGVEMQFNYDLSRESAEKNKQGKDIFLTIDRNIQARAEEILASLVETHKADGGTVIVEEPKTGKILALGNYPNFDPNSYGSSPVKNFLNPAVQALYEPGSIFKVVTMSSALDAHAVAPDTRFYDTGSLDLNGKTIKNWDLKAHGSVTMTEVIEQSINTGAAFAERKLGHDNFYNYLVNFGFDDKTKIDLPGEISGNLRNLQKSFREINFATASFGQGVSVTPLELINAISAIANGGILMRPFITADDSPSIVHRVVSREAALGITRMMTSAVAKAVVAKINQYEVAGKTGTAQIPDFKHGGYTHDVINTYAGFAPAFDPRFVILIKLEKPYGAPLAGATVVPAFRELAEFILNYYNVPPDHK